MNKDIRLLYIDLFCGAGGTSTGCENAVIGGRKIAKVIACVNHDTNAIASHKANHPDAIHYTEDIRTLDLGPMRKHVAMARRTYPDALVVLWASLECTNFSRAKGGMSRDADSRTLAEHLYRYVETIRPDIIQIENVEEFQTWGPLTEKRRNDGSVVMVKKSEGRGKARKVWEEPAMIPDPLHKGEYYQRWISRMCAYGYSFDSRILNSADYGAYTSRRRYFGMFARPGIDITFPEPTHTRRPEPTVFGDNLKPWRAVRDVLDLSDEGQSIFGRKKPLVEATLRRILAGLRKYVATGETAILTSPQGKKKKGPAFFLDNQYGTGVPSYGDEPAHTIGAVPKVKPVRIHFLDNQYGKSRCSSVDQPAGTVTANPKQCLVEAVKAPWLMDTSFGNVGGSILEPCRTVTANRKWHYLVNPQFADPGSSIDGPCPTVIARQDKKPLSLAGCRTDGPLAPFIRAEDGSLIFEVYNDDCETLKEIKRFMASHGITDITMRMLRIRELKLIQGFPADYVLVGSQEQQKKYLGNAVVTIMAKVWCEAIVQKINNRPIAKTA